MTPDIQSSAQKGKSRPVSHLTVSTTNLPSTTYLEQAVHDLEGRAKSRHHTLIKSGFFRISGFSRTGDVRLLSPKPRYFSE